MAERSGVASANIIWWARTVLPHPGDPAMRLKENSGSPPPSTSSRPGTPVRRQLMRILVVIGRFLGTGATQNAVPAGAKQPLRQGTADQSSQKVVKGLKQRTARCRRD